VVAKGTRGRKAMERGKKATAAATIEDRIVVAGERRL